MSKFLIEVPHEADALACARVAQVFLASGSHFLTNAEWGCIDGVHVAWMIVEVGSKAEARAILPPAFRDQARIVHVTRFKLAAVEETIRRHTQAGSGGGPGGV
jgi:hypothetical protein